MRTLRWGPFVIAICLLLPVPAVAQVTTADILGRVLDVSGAVLPGATVTISNEGTGDTRTAPTNASGDYAFNLLPIGTYSVQVELQGFGTQTVRLVLSAGDRARFDARLQLGAVSENITVTAQAALLQTDSSTVGSLINLREVQDLPVNGRNFIRLVQSLPGANEGLPNSLASGTRPDDRRMTSAISINGASDNTNNQMIDGMDNNERAIGTIGVKPSIDAIAEIKVQTSNYTAEVGRTAGGVVNILTKSGTNRFSGTAFEFYRNERFDARNFFARTKPALRQHQFGASLGGPLRVNRTFFFGDYEGFRQQQDVTNVATLPTMRMRTGDFSEIAGLIYDPLTTPRTPFPGNRIPLSRLNPIALRYLALLPVTTSTGLANNFAGITQRTQYSKTADARIDHRLSGNATIFGRYSWNDVDTFTPAACPKTSDGIDPGCGGGLAFPGPNTTKAHGTQVNYLHVWNPTLLSELRGGYLKMRIESLPVNYGNNVSQTFGIPGVNIDALTSGLMPVTLTGFAAMGEATFIPLLQVDDTWQVNGTVTKTTGAHNLKIGASYISRQFTVFQSSQPLGTMTFDPRLTDNGAGSGGNSIASFLLGYPSQVSRAHSLVYPRYQTNEPSVFVQDDWRPNAWLTLNLGVRYDVFTAWTEKDNNISNFDPTTAKVIIAGRDGVSRTAGVATDFGNIAPRLGFSATLPGRAVLRGGYGLAYYPGSLASPFQLKNQPFVSSYGPLLSGGTTGGAPSLLLANGMPVPAPTDYVTPSGAITAVALDFKATRAHQFNLIAEKEVAGSTVGIGYVGSRTDRVANAVNLNLAPVGAGAVQARRPYNGVLPGISNINVQRSEYEARYDALQLVFQRRYSGGLSFNSNYTLAFNRTSAPVPWDTARTEWFWAGNDVRHRWGATANYELPFGRNLSGASAAALRGWQVNVVVGVQTGLPFDITNATARGNTGGGDRPNQIGDPTVETPTAARWFNTAAFQAQAANTIGTAVVERNLLHGPTQRRVDLSLFKNVEFGGGSRLQLRWEIYNAFNTTNFANPNGALGNAAFGTISSTVGTPRQMQFAAKFLF